MGKFLDSEKQRLIAWKQETRYLSERARAPGRFRGKMRDFCVLPACAEENLYSESRLAALGYCAAYGVKWHQGQKCKCSNHLCDSMVSCFNFLFPFADKPEALAALLRSVFPSVKRILPMEDSGLWMAFEWIGMENYLGELVRGNRARTRGANFTSADAAVRFEDHSGRIQIALIEWKYTESYGRSSKARGKSGERRQRIYRQFFEDPDGPVDAGKVPGYRDLFYEPFYQMMRQQFLAHEMEKANELDAEIVTVVHISPTKNTDIHRVTSPGLEALGDSALEVWASLLRGPERFVQVHTEELFHTFDVGVFPAMSGWHDYIQSRYAL
jgi:hypothetical protein